jgi:hypothetical protein
MKKIDFIKSRGNQSIILLKKIASCIDQLVELINVDMVLLL